jgi:hypothetical protein
MNMNAVLDALGLTSQNLGIGTNGSLNIGNQYGNLQTGVNQNNANMWNGITGALGGLGNIGGMFLGGGINPAMLFGGGAPKTISGGNNSTSSPTGWSGPGP